MEYWEEIWSMAVRRGVQLGECLGGRTWSRSGDDDVTEPKGSLNGEISRLATTLSVPLAPKGENGECEVSKR